MEREDAAPPDDIRPLSMQLTGFVTGFDDPPGAGAFGTDAFVDYKLTPPPDDDLPAASFFDVFVEIMPPGEGTAAPGFAHPPEPGTVASSFFDVFFDVSVPGVGVAQHRLHFAIGQGQPLQFSNVVVGSPLSPAFHITFELDRTGAPDLNIPLFTSEATAAVPEPVPLVLLVAAALALPLARRPRRGGGVTPPCRSGARTAGTRRSAPRASCTRPGASRA